MTENGFEYVDLGLPSGTMWATCNVGASKKEEPGLLFQFGSIVGYRYGDENHMFKQNGNVSYSRKKYNAHETLDLNDDAAHVNMGGAWRMPTLDQTRELYLYTNRNVKKINGMKGMLFTSKINNKKLFFPFSGYWEYYNNTFNYINKRTHIWISEVPDFTKDGYLMYCYSNGANNCIGDLSVHYAYSIRGVFNTSIN